MVEGYFNQQGQNYNVHADYAARGDGFSISFNLTPANDANIGVEYASYGKMALLMGMNGQSDGWNSIRFLEISTAVFEGNRSGIETAFKYGIQNIPGQSGFSESAEKLLGKIGKGIGFVNIATSGYTLIENPTIGNALKFGVNVATTLLRVNPITGLIISISDVTGVSDFVYDKVGGFLEGLFYY